MTTLYVLDVPEFAPLADHAHSPAGLRKTKLGDYLRLESDGDIMVAREDGNFVDAVWFSVLGGGFDGRLKRFDAERIHLAPLEPGAVA